MPKAGNRPSLLELQRRFASFLLEGESDPTLAHEHWLCRPPQGGLPERLRVYRDGYPARIHGALGETFPAVRHLAGQREFCDLAERYARHTPLVSYSLNDAGTSFGAFLQQDPLSHRLPFLIDLARLEWAVWKAFHAFQEISFDPRSAEGWGDEDWSDAVIELQPSVSVVVSSWPVLEIWRARNTPVERIDIDLVGHPEQVIVHRSGLKVHTLPVELGEANALAVLSRGQTLAAVAEDLAQAGEDPDGVARWFARWVRLGLVACCRRAGDMRR